MEKHANNGHVVPLLIQARKKPFYLLFCCEISLAKPVLKSKQRTHELCRLILVETQFRFLHHVSRHVHVSQ